MGPIQVATVAAPPMVCRAPLPIKPIPLRFNVLSMLSGPASGRARSWSEPPLATRTAPPVSGPKARLLVITRLPKLTLVAPVKLGLAPLMISALERNLVIVAAPLRGPERTRLLLVSPPMDVLLANWMAPDHSRQAKRELESGGQGKTLLLPVPLLCNAPKVAPVPVSSGPTPLRM